MEAEKNGNLKMASQIATSVAASLICVIVFTVVFIHESRISVIENELKNIREGISRIETKVDKIADKTGS